MGAPAAECEPLPSKSFFMWDAQGKALQMHSSCRRSAPLRLDLTLTICEPCRSRLQPAETPSHYRKLSGNGRR